MTEPLSDRKTFIVYVCEKHGQQHPRAHVWLGKGRGFHIECPWGCTMRRLTTMEVDLDA